MAKEIKHEKCNTNCTSAIKINNENYCVMKLKDKTKPTDTAVLTYGECLWFRKRITKSNTLSKKQRN